MQKRNQFLINAGVIKGGKEIKNSNFISLDKIVWDILKCCGIDCCSGFVPSNFNFPNLIKETFITPVSGVNVYTISGTINQDYLNWITVIVNGKTLITGSSLFADEYSIATVGGVSTLYINTPTFAGSIIEIRYI